MRSFSKQTMTLKLRSGAAFQITVAAYADLIVLSRPRLESKMLHVIVVRIKIS